MKYLRQLATTLKQLGIKVDPKVWIVLGILVPVLICAGLWLWLRYKKKKKGHAAPKEEGEPASVRPAPAPRTDTLWKVWKRFLAELPRLYQRSILRFQPFVVLGAAGAGKSQAVEAYTDWRRQKLQFLGSALEDPNLQIYLGSQVLVFELPAPLSLDTSSHARKRLLKLWRPLFKKRTPTAVVVADLSRLAASPPDAVRDLADTLRGKLNLLAEAHRGPIEVRLVLTRLDLLEGFAEFARFLEAERIPATLQLEPGAEQDYAVEGALQESFAQFDRLLPLALTTVPAESYLKIIAFLRQAPTQLGALRAFLPPLVSTDALARRPVLEQIYLAGAGKGANPFHAVAGDSEDLPTPLRRHRVLAGTVALLGILYLGASYFHERALWSPSRAAMLNYESVKDPQRERLLRQEVTAFREREKRDAMLRVIPAFFDSGGRWLDDGLARSIRDRQLLPGLDRALSSDWSHRKSLYFLALLYSTRTNDLGKLVRAQEDNWAAATGLDRQLIEDYIESAHVPYEKKAALDRLPAQVAQSAANDPQPWVLYFLRVQRALDGGFVTPEELTSLQVEAGQLLQAEAVVERFEATPTVLRELDETTGYGFQAEYAPYLKDVHSRAVFGSTLPDVKAALELIKGSQLNASADPTPLLADLCARLRLILDKHPGEQDQTFSLQFGEQRFGFKAQDWAALLRNSAARAEVLRFVHQDGEASRSIFFAQKESSTAVMMNPGNNGQFLFTGKAALDDRYTRATFDRTVRPVLIQLNDLLLQVSLGADERRLLEEFVYREVERYAAHYTEAIDRYYNAYGVSAQSPEAVQLLVKQMMRPDSPFKALLRVVATNTQLELDAAKVHFFQPMNDALAKYAALDRVMADKGGGAQELDNYQAILEQLLLSLRAQPAAGGAAKPGDKAAPAEAAPPVTQLSDLLTPTGKTALKILQGQKDSYWQLVHDWLANVGLGSELAGPFVAPVDALYDVGLKEIQGAVADGWNHQVVTSLNEVLTAFPFDPASTVDATPEALTEAFHPLTGKFQDLRRRFVDPISQKGPAGWTWRIGAGRIVETPPGMYELVNHVERLGQALWDAQGKPQPLKLRVSPVPFPASESKKSALTLVYLSSGASSLFNFNQQPVPRVVDLDWTHAQRAQVGLELTNTLTGEKTYPPAIVTRDSPWGLLHLLQQGTRDGEDWMWVFRYGKDGDQATAVSFAVEPDPWRLFSLRPASSREHASRSP